MTKVLRRILFVFFSLLIISVLVYITLELSGIDETEQKVQSVYEDQLDAIKFSINQYSQDVLGAWVDDLSIELSKDAHDINRLDFLMNHQSVTSITIVDSLSKMMSSQSVKESEKVRDLLKAHSETITRLFEYSKVDFYKLEPLLDVDGLSYLLFINARKGLKELVILNIDSEKFISEVLGPRLESITREKLILSVYSKTLDTVVYSTNIKLLGDDDLLMTPESNLWLFPSNYLSINFIGETLEELVRRRMRNNFIILGIICLIFIGGVVLILRNVRKQVQLANMKSDFVSNVSHEIRTPLALISMYAETLEMDRVKDDMQRNQFYKIILAETRRLTGLVNRILKFSRLEAGKNDYNFENADLNTIVDEVLLSFDFHLTEKKFMVNTIKNDLPRISMDKEAIETSVFNLIDNAIKYSGESRKIDVTTGIDDKNVFVSVKDYGIGIAGVNQKRVYEKFYRVESASVHTTKGSGLGLNLVRSIVGDHQGRIELESEKGAGSTFTIYLPIERSKV